MNPVTKKPPHKVTTLQGLARAVVKGQLRRIRAYLDLNPKMNLNSRLPEGMKLGMRYDFKGTLLHLARHGAVVRELVARGADPNSKAADKTTPLVAAVERGSVAAALAMMEAGADVNLANAEGKTALLLATFRCTDMVVPLLKAGANPNARDRYENTPLWTAYEAGNKQALFALLKHGADPDVLGSEGRALLCDVYMDRTLTDALLEAGSDPKKVLNRQDRHGLIPLSLITSDYKNNEAEVEALLKLGASPHANSSEGTPFGQAVYVGNKRYVALLLQYGADPNLPTRRAASGGSALREAVEELCTGGEGDYREIIKLLVEHGAPLISTPKGPYSLSDAITHAREAGEHDVMLLMQRWLKKEQAARAEARRADLAASPAPHAPATSARTSGPKL